MKIGDLKVIDIVSTLCFKYRKVNKLFVKCKNCPLLNKMEYDMFIQYCEFAYWAEKLKDVEVNINENSDK
ncbi:MAG TPA: hypothetical protein ENH82_08705 [bacterium]|nr:hypothetical protein [bacterium]